MQDKIAKIRDYIYDSVEERNYPPTVREICSEFNIKSTSSAFYYLRKLEDSGELRLSKQKSRGIETVKPSNILKLVKDVPSLGTITAGSPILAFEDYGETYYLPNNLFNLEGDLFILDVVGTSMIGAGINDGDKIIVRKQDTAQSGQIIVALVGGECATVKRLIIDKKGVCLHPENPNMNDIYPEEITILGVVVGLLRTEIK